MTEPWKRLGTDIDGEAPGDNSGFAVSLSADGTIVAIGAYTNDGNNGNIVDSGSVRVYKWNGTTWVQLGTDIDGKAPGDVFGFAVSLSADGTIVAIGAPTNYGLSNDSKKGSVRVYKWNGTTTWVQLGADIDGEAFGDAFGSAVSLSADGTKIAIGATDNDGVNRINSGSVRVYQWNGTTTWEKLGSDIDGEAYDDYSGWSVSLNADGTILAIGAIYNDGVNGINSGSVRVYKWNGTTWVQLGTDIDGKAPGDGFGFAVSLSADGTILAIGAIYNDGVNGSDSGSVGVYKWNGTTWVQLGADIDGKDPGDVFGFAVSLSADGTIVVIGAPTNYGYPNDSRKGSVGVYQWNGTTWVQLGADIDGEAFGDVFGFAVSLSSDGTKIAIGAVYNDDAGINSGSVRVYNNPITVICNSDNVSFDSQYGFYLFANDGVSFTYVTNLTIENIPDDLFKNYDSILSIILNNGVKTIQYNAFSGCTSLTSITIPNSVTSIGRYVFEGCTALTSIPILGSLTTIPEGAFRHCTGFTSVTVPSNITSIGPSAFSECTSLTSITIPNSVTSIGRYVFEGCTALTSIPILESLTTIPEGAFLDCTGFTSITIPSNITSIGPSAFQDCTSLTSLTILSNCAIGPSAFKDCTSLTSLTILSNCTIGPSAFQGCIGFINDNNNLSGFENVQTIGAYAFQGCNSLTLFPSIPNVKTIGAYAFQGCNRLPSVSSQITSNLVSIGEGAFQDCYRLTTFQIPTSISAISNSVFQGCYGFQSVTIPNSILSIGNSAFQDCSGLTGITVPQRVSNIGSSVFKNCINMNSVSLPGSVFTIGNSTFEGCSSITSLSIPSQVTIISANLCKGCSNLSNVIIPSKVTSIGASAFQGCSELKTLLLPSVLTTIGSNAFAGCPKFSTINVYSSITEPIGENIFGPYTSNHSNAPDSPELIMRLVIPNTTVSLPNIPIYSYTSTNYPNMLIDIKYINDINTSSTITVVTPTNNITDPDTVTTCNAITQLRRSRIPSTVPIRFNPVSPYPQFSQTQLDMRRKAEILQYRANNSNTKQNGTTQKQAFSYLVNNPNIAASTSSLINRKVCDLNLIPVPTSASDVPGPIEYLYMDPSIPLYNYTTNRSYNSYIQTDTREWNIFTYTDVETSDTDDKTVMSIYIRQGVKNNYTTFSLIAPMMITVSGRNNTSTDYDLDFSRNTVSIIVTQVVLQIHYNNTTIQNITINNPTNAQTPNKLSVMYLNTANSGGNQFSANVLIGKLEVNNILLYTPPNIIYDINILTTVVLDTGSQDFNEAAYFLDDITYSAIFNPTTEDTSTNCVANTTPP